MKTMSALRATATISAAIVLALLTVQGTLALWNTSTTSRSQTVQSADFHVAVAVDGNPQQRLPAGGKLTLTGPAGLTPGISQTSRVVVTNETKAGGSFTVRATAGAVPDPGPLAQYLDTSIGTGQGGTCNAVQQGFTIDLAKGASGTFCLTSTLKANTPATLGGSGASIAFTLTTEQQPR